MLMNNGRTAVNLPSVECNMTFQQNTSTRNSDRDQRMTVITQQCKTAFICQFNHGLGETFFGVEEFRVNVFKVNYTSSETNVLLDDLQR